MWLDIVMAYIVMAHIVMALLVDEPRDRVARLHGVAAGLDQHAVPGGDRADHLFLYLYFCSESAGGDRRRSLVPM